MKSRKGLRRTTRELRYINRLERAKRVWRKPRYTPAERRAFRAIWRGNLEEPRYWDRDGKPIYDLHTWSNAFEDPAYRCLKATRFGSDERACMVSTIWRGIDTGIPWEKHGPPRIFQTMLFIGTAPVLSGAREILHEQEWLSAYEREALITHRAIARWFAPIHAALNGHLVHAWGERGMRNAATIAETIHEIAEVRRALEKRVGA